MSEIPTIAPIQKDKTTPESARESPSSQPRLIASFASPSPIHLPEETNQNKANGNAKKIPESNCEIVGI